MTKGEVMIYAACYGSAFARGENPENAALDAWEAVEKSRDFADRSDDGDAKRLKQVLDYDG